MASIIIENICDCPEITYNLGQVTPTSCSGNTGSVVIDSIQNGSVSGSTTGLSFGPGSITIQHSQINCPDLLVPYNIPCENTGCSGTDTCDVSSCNCVPEDCNLVGQTCSLGQCYNDGTYNSDCVCVGSPCSFSPNINCGNDVTIETFEFFTPGATATDNCTGQSVSTNCTWNGNSVNSGLSFSSPGVYTITCTAQGSCPGAGSSSCSVSVTVVDPPKPCDSNPCEGCGVCRNINNDSDYTCDCIGSCNQGSCENTYTQTDGKRGCECISDPCNPNPCGPCQDCNNGVCTGPIIGESCDDNNLCTFNTVIQNNCNCGGGQTSNCTQPCTECDGVGGCIGTCNQTCCEGSCVPNCTSGFTGLCCCNGTLINKTDTCNDSDFITSDCSCSTITNLGRCCYGANQCEPAISQTRCEGPGPLGLEGDWTIGASCPCPCQPNCPTNCGQYNECNGPCPNTDVGQECPDPSTLCVDQTQDKDLCGNNCPGTKDCTVTCDPNFTGGSIDCVGGNIQVCADMNQLVSGDTYCLKIGWGGSVQQETSFISSGSTKTQCITLNNPPAEGVQIGASIVCGNC